MDYRAIMTPQKDSSIKTDDIVRGGNGALNIASSHQGEIPNAHPQYLHIIHRQPVKINDWTIEAYVVHQATIFEADDLDWVIVASTDKSLGVHGIPRSYVETYVRWALDKPHILNVELDMDGELPRVVNGEVVIKRVIPLTTTNMDRTQVVMHKPSLYQQIEHAVIEWSLDGTLTAGTLTREIMNMVRAMEPACAKFIKCFEVANLCSECKGSGMCKVVMAVEKSLTGGTGSVS